MVTPSVIVESDHDHVGAEITRALTEWNERQAGPLDSQPVTLTIRAADGELLAGLVGEMFWTFLYISVLWVKEDHRRRGYGSALLRQSEMMALERACVVAFLNTMSFQAPEFYEKCGYERFAVLPHAPADCGRIWFAKQLKP